MFVKKRKHLVWLLTIVFLLAQVVLAAPVLAQTSTTDKNSSTGVGRLAGEDRYQTAVAVSQKGWKTAEYAVLARGDNFADALCAGPLAQKYNGPILLTAPNELNSSTLKELKRLGVKHLFITGGAGAVSQAVEDALKAGGIADIERIYGSDRYDTSVKIAEKLGTSDKAVLATGSDFPDALSISVVASKLGIPILLTAKDSLPAAVAQYFQSNVVTRTYLTGGTGVIGSSVEKSVPGALRISGSDRYATNIAVLQNFAKEFSFENIYVAIGGGPQGNEFADALTGAVLAAKNSSPLILTGKTLPQGTADYLKGKLLLTSRATGLGGKTVVPSAVLAGIIAYKEQIPVAQKYNIAGTYGPETGKETIVGSVTISARDVTLRNTVIEGDLLLAQSIGDGNVYLKDVTVQGKTIINGGGPNSVIMYNFNGQTVVVDVPDGSSVRLVAQGSTSVNNISMEGDGTLQESELTGAGFINVEIPAGAEVTLSGSFDQVNVEAAGASVNVAGGSITTMNISETAEGAGVNLSGGTSVGTLNANAASNITGQGQITTANVNTNNVSIEQTPGNTNVASGVTANVGGQTQTGSTPQTGGSDSNPAISPSGVQAVDRTTVEVTMAQLNGVAFTWNGSSVLSLVYAGGKYILTVPLIQSGANNTLSVRKSGYDSYTNNAVVWTDPLTYTDYPLSAWAQDRTEPKTWTITADWITLETKTEPANNWYAWQGRKCATNNAVTTNWKAETEIDLTEALLARDGVRTSMWLNVQDHHGQDLDWAILQFKIDNANQTKGWQWWDEAGDDWVDIDNISAAAGKHKLAIYFDNGTIKQYIDGVKVNEYTLGNTASSVKEVIFNSYSFGQSYTANWKVPAIKYVDKFPLGAIIVLAGESIQSAVDGAASGQTIALDAAEYPLTQGLAINKPLTIQGATAGTTKVIGEADTAVPAMVISASNVTVKNLNLTVSQSALDAYKVKAGPYDGLIQVPEIAGGYNGIQILNNKIWVPNQGTSDTMSTWAAFGVKILRYSQVTVKNNTIYNTRQGISGSYGSKLTVEDNTIYYTKGGICIYTNQGDIAAHTITGNKWDAPNPAFSHNEWDITWHTGGTYTSADWPAHYHTYVYDLSQANNGAYVVDRRGEGITQAAGGNRSHVFVDPAGTTVYDSVKGNVREPFGTIELGLQAVVTGGTVYVKDGTYNLAAPLNINKAVTVEGLNKETVVLQGSNTIANTVSIANGATLKNVTVTRDNSGVWADNKNNSLVAFGQNLTAETILDNCIIKYGRNGVYLNNTGSAVITNNLIDNNRTGIQMANSVSARVENNTITNNHTEGVLLQYLSADNYGIPTFTGNTIKDNWYSDFENRWPARTPQYQVDLSDNTFTDLTSRIADNSGEPGYNDLQPVELGGTAVRPATRVTFVMKISGNLILPLILHL